MTDDTTDRDTQTPGPTAPHRRWVSTLALVCVAAIAGGAGTVLMSPGNDGMTPSATGMLQSGKRIRGRCERLIEMTFNPRAVRGSRAKVAKVAFRFSYETDPRFRDLVKKRIEDNWDLIISRTLFVLRKRTPYELNAAESNASQALDEDLRRAITGACFPDGVAMVDLIYWRQIIVQ